MAGLACFLVFYLCLHACTGRPLMLSDKKFATQLHLLNKDHKALDMAELDNLKFFLDKNGENNEEVGYCIRILTMRSSWKILHQASGTEISRRVGRLMLASLVSKAEENLSSKDNGVGTVEDIVVMDYAQPHRKPPIHNKGT